MIKPILDWINSQHYILEESNFNFRSMYVRLNYLQTVETLFRRRSLWRLIRICLVCQSLWVNCNDLFIAMTETTGFNWIHWISVTVPMRFLLNSFSAKFQTTFVVCFFILTRYRLERRLYIKLRPWMLNSVDPDETAQYGSLSRLIWICAVCKNLLLSPLEVKEFKGQCR